MLAHDCLLYEAPRSRRNRSARNGVALSRMIGRRACFLLLLSVALVASCSSQPTGEPQAGATAAVASRVPSAVPSQIQSSPTTASPTAEPSPIAMAKPAPRLDPATAWDSTRGQLVIFGGWDGNNLGDTWTWGGNWTQHSVNGPSGRRFAAMAFDPIGGVAVLYGGETCPENCTLHDTWVWDGSSWTQNNPVHQPSIQGVMTYDPMSHSILLWGLSAPCCSSADAETWRWTGTDWAQLDVQPAGSQITRLNGYQFELGADPSTGLIILVGHVGANTPNTWEWDGSKWSLIGQVGPNGYQFNMQSDPASKTVVVVDEFGTWSWDGKQWTVAAATGTGPWRVQEAGLAYDDRDKWVLLFGGDNTSGSGLKNDLWAWDEHGWTQV
jgi:hypothetical protein